MPITKLYNNNSWLVAGGKELILDTALNTNSQNPLQNSPITYALDGKASNPNILDNGWFTINSRGQTTYGGEGKYGIIFADRWYIGWYTNTITVNSNGINIVGTPWIQQPINQLEVGKTYTGSVLLGNGTLYSGTFVAGEYNNTTVINQIFSKGYNTTALRLEYIYGTDSHRYKYWIRLLTAGRCDGIDVRAIKLEVGSKSSLDHDIPPLDSAESIRCFQSTTDIDDKYTHSVPPIFEKRKNCSIPSYTVLTPNYWNMLPVHGYKIPGSNDFRAFNILETVYPPGYYSSIDHVPQALINNIATQNSAYGGYIFVNIRDLGYTTANISEGTNGYTIKKDGTVSQLLSGSLQTLTDDIVFFVWFRDSESEAIMTITFS